MGKTLHWYFMALKQEKFILTERFSKLTDEDTEF